MSVISPRTAATGLQNVISFISSLPGGWVTQIVKMGLSPTYKSLCRTLPLCWKSFSENTTPHQQHWANSVQKSLSNHLLVIGLAEFFIYLLLFITIYIYTYKYHQRTELFEAYFQFALIRNSCVHSDAGLNSLVPIICAHCHINCSRCHIQ